MLPFFALIQSSAKGVVYRRQVESHFICAGRMRISTHYIRFQEEWT